MGSSTIGIAVQRATRSQWLGILSGAVAGAGLGAAAMAIGWGTGGLAAGVISGALLGAFETFRGDSEARSRDSSNGALVASLFLDGPARLAGGLGSLIGCHMDSTGAKVAVSAAVGAAVGASVAAAGLGSAGIVTAAVVSGVCGAIGPFFGPRFSQLFRNLAQDIGNGVQHAGQKLGILKKPLNGKASLSLGAIPGSFAKEALRAMAYSGGSLPALIVAGVKESIRQAHLLWFSRVEPELTPKKKDYEVN
ncbi:MAG: hypothetical protein HY319_07495 [Armatimonadetes bacterium]|nr:hypothetical protein [Armatimonadota bacterium]